VARQSSVDEHAARRSFAAATTLQEGTGGLSLLAIILTRLQIGVKLCKFARTN
jgi:hypothetical protein